MSTITFTRAFAMLSAALAVLVVLFAAPDDAQAQTTRVELQVDVILASNSGNGVASELRPYAGRLQSQFPQFNTFRRALSRSIVLHIGREERLAIPGASTVGFEFLGESGGRHRIDVEIPGGHTTFESPSGGMIFVGGFDVAGETAILLIRTRS